MLLYILCSVTCDAALALSPESTLFIECSTEVPVAFPPSLAELYVHLFDTAHPPHDLYASVHDTALLLVTVPLTLIL